MNIKRKSRSKLFSAEEKRNFLDNIARYVLLYYPHLNLQNLKRGHNRDKLKAKRTIAYLAFSYDLFGQYIDRDQEAFAKQDFDCDQRDNCLTIEEIATYLNTKQSSIANYLRQSKHPNNLADNCQEIERAIFQNPLESKIIRQLAKHHFTFAAIWEQTSLRETLAKNENALLSFEDGQEVVPPEQIRKTLFSLDTGLVSPNDIAFYLSCLLNQKNRIPTEKTFREISEIFGLEADKAAFKFSDFAFQVKIVQNTRTLVAAAHSFIAK